MTRCPRCGGFVHEDKDGDVACFNCGHRVAWGRFVPTPDSATLWYGSTTTVMRRRGSVPKAKLLSGDYG